MTNLAVAQDAVSRRPSQLAWNYWRDGYIAFTRPVRSDRSHLKSGAWYEILPLYRDGQRTAYDVFYHRSPFLVSHRFTGSRHSAIGSAPTLARAKALAQMHRNNRARANPMTSVRPIGTLPALHWHHDRDGWFAWTLPERKDGSHHAGAWYEITPTRPHEVYYHGPRREGPKGGRHGPRPVHLGSTVSLDAAKGYALTDFIDRSENPLPTSTKLGIGLLAAGFAAAGVVLWRGTAKAASAKPGAPGSSAAAAVVPAGATWTPLAPTDTAGGGGTYLMSIAPIPGATFAALQSELAPAGSVTTVLGAWPQGTVPGGWPASDRDPNRWRLEFKVASGVPTQPVSEILDGLPAPAMFQLQA